MTDRQTALAAITVHTDPSRFYTALYRLLPKIVSMPGEQSAELWPLLLRTLHTMFVTRCRHVSPARVAAFVKRLTLLALVVDRVDVLTGVLALVRLILMVG